MKTDNPPCLRFGIPGDRVPGMPLHHAAFLFAAVHVRQMDSPWR
jgi:hypothetical protein